MTQWKIGMLAVCINDGPHPETPYLCSMKDIKVDAVYRVCGIETPLGDLCLDLEGVHTTEVMAGMFGAWRFRPAVTDNKAADTDFTALIKGKVGA